MEQCNACKCSKGCNQDYKKSCMNKSECKWEKTMPCTEYENDEIGCMPLAMAYVPWQEWGDVYTAECALAHGTIFPELVKPWWVSCGQKCTKGCGDDSVMPCKAPCAMPCEKPCKTACKQTCTTTCGHTCETTCGMRR